MTELEEVTQAAAAYGATQNADGFTKGKAAGFTEGATSRQPEIDRLKADLAAALANAQPTTTLPMVRPLSSQVAHQGYGYCAHPTYKNGIYANLDTWMAALAKSGATYFRGGMSGAASINASVVAACRKFGLKWLVLVAPEDWSVPVSEVKSRIDWFAANGADVVWGFEGINEPNHERSGGTPPTDWAQRTVAYQKAIWDAWALRSELALARVIGASMHATAVRPQDYVTLKTLGITNYQHMAGVHSYMGGDAPLAGMQARFDMVKAAYGPNTKFCVTETGWHNAVATTGGHKPATEAACEVYGPRLVLMLAALGVPACRYELMDDPDAGTKDVQESNFGVIAVSDNTGVGWRTKPEYASVAALLQDLADPGQPYTPAEVPLKVEAPASVVWVVTGKRDGSAKVRMFLNKPVWDPNTRKALPVPAPVTVKITDRAGARNVQVGASVTSVAVR